MTKIQLLNLGGVAAIFGAFILALIAYKYGLPVQVSVWALFALAAGAVAVSVEDSDV